MSKSKTMEKKVSKINSLVSENPPKPPEMVTAMKELE